MNFKKLFLLGIIALAIFLFFIFDLAQYLSIDYVKLKQNDFNMFYKSNQVLTISVFFGIYVLVTALSLPGAAMMTLLAGALFGFVTGLVLVSFASSMGATLAFLSSRFILKDLFQNRYGHKLKAINEGIEKEGGFYLFTLRLIPAFPFFLVNILMGLTPIKTIRYYFISQVGMLPGSVVYVYAGLQLRQIDSLSGILSPGLIFAFTLLGIFPWIAKWFVEYLKSRKVMRTFKKPAKFDYNLVVIGAGAGGLVSAYIASAIKAKVVLIEKAKMGGDCLNYGCVPSKALIRSAKMLSYAKRSKEWGFKNTIVDFDFADVMERVQKVIKKVEPHDSVERYSKLGVECISGHARIKSPYSVEVNGKELTTKNIIIATGAKPFVPYIPGLDSIEYYTSDTIWSLREKPDSLIVLGGGPIGCELAQCFSRLDVKVTQIQRGKQLLVREDKEVIDLVTEKFQKEGIQLFLGYAPKEFITEDGKKYLICVSGDEEVKIECDKVLIALGRKPNTKGLGAESIGLSLEPRGHIQTNSLLQTNFPNIYACGDIITPYQFTHTAAHEAWYASVNALFRPIKKFKVDYSVIPWTTFTDPEVARVGLNEKDAMLKDVPYEVTTYGIDDLDRAIADSEDHGFVKVLTIPAKDTILGVTIVGAHAGDLIHEFILAMKNKIGLNKILGTIHIYPTLAEASKYAAGNWKKKHVPAWGLRFLEKYHHWRRG
jgi:pyruvate/2-oxoglutarate dehydrogenase complex dihydrolipoamide dehydrogenase (E3) component/uncharacterized membrane protein YdjX (TVP38/TMEM64 family)